MSHEIVEMFKYGNTTLYVEHDANDFVIKVKEEGNTGGENV